MFNIPKSVSVVETAEKKRKESHPSEKGRETRFTKFLHQLICLVPQRKPFSEISYPSRKNNSIKKINKNKTFDVHGAQ